MKQLFILLSIASLGTFAKAQIADTTKHMMFNEIGWSFDMPRGFDLIDTSSLMVRVSANRSYWSKKFMLKNKTTYFTCSISAINADDDKNWAGSFGREKDRFYELINKQNPSLQIDTSTSIETIDSELFSKFLLVGREKGEIVYNHIQLRKLYKNYRAIVVYESVDEMASNEIEKMLKNSTFIK